MITRRHSGIGADPINPVKEDVASFRVPTSQDLGPEIYNPNYLKSASYNRCLSLRVILRL
jgi:hypothetical protein